jgi:hypothetical protein
MDGSGGQATAEYLATRFPDSSRRRDGPRHKGLVAGLAIAIFFGFQISEQNASSTQSLALMVFSPKTLGFWP